MSNDFSGLAEMTYSGRGLTVFKTPSGAYGIGYSLTGRSPSSQARRLKIGTTKSGGTTHTISTQVTDIKQLQEGNPALLLYPALTSVDLALIGSNGVQTELVYGLMRDFPTTYRNESEQLIIKAFENPKYRYDSKNDDWIDITSFEPDDPNFTPRITACIFPGNSTMFIVKKSGTTTFRDKLSNGQGSLITTYEGGNEKPLKPFGDRAIDVSIESENATEIAEAIYEAIGGGQTLNDNYRVASGVILAKGDAIEMAEISRIDRGE